MNPDAPYTTIRAVSYTPLWFGITVWVLFGGSILAGTMWLLYEDYLFAYDAKTVTAIVERKYTRKSHDKHGDHYTPWLDYQYHVGPVMVACSASVQGDTYSAVTPGAAMPVLYLPAEPASNRIDLPPERESIKWISYGLVVASLIASVGGGLVLRYYAGRNRLYQFLRDRGLSCQGTVLEIKFNLVGKARTKRYYLTFTFRDNQGQERTGSTWYLKRGTETFWAAGQDIPVYFDPVNSARFTVTLDSPRTII